MKEWARWVFLSVIGVIGILAVAILVLYIIALLRLNRSYEVQEENIVIPSDSLALERGKHLVEAVTACTACHGESLQGLAFIDSSTVGLIYAANLTSGEGGVGADYSDADWERAIRHGVDPGGEALLLMPSHHFASLSDADLGAIIAYLKSVPPVDNPSRDSRMAFPAYLLFAAGGLSQLPAEQVEHTAGHPNAKAEVSSEYGEYLTNIGTCKVCHGQDLQGGQAAPEDPPAPDISLNGELASWSEADFFTLMREGKKPYDAQIDPSMPWQNYRQMSDDELRAIWMYIQSMPASSLN
jgi:cytochrome c553